MKRVPLALAAPLLLAGCGQDGAAANDAAALERAADRGTSDTENLLRNAADPGGNVQDAPPTIAAEGNGQ